LVDFENLTKDEEKKKNKKEEEEDEMKIDPELEELDDEMKFYHEISKYTSDIKVISSDNKELYLHKALLIIKSNYFRVLLSGKFEDTKNNEIKFEEDIVTCEAIFNSLYTHNKNWSIPSEFALSIVKKIFLI
jgi:hypothetical protein